MCERRSRVSGSIVWYSSSIPMVNEGFMLSSQLSAISIQLETFYAEDCAPIVFLLTDLPELFLLVRASTDPAEAPVRKDDQRRSFAGFSSLNALLTANSATAFTIQSKFSCPTECKSASGAGFMKSMA